MARLAQLPSDMIFFTQITMEAAEDTEFLDAMKAAHIKGALVGVESVTPEGLKDVYKEFNVAGERFGRTAKNVWRHGVYVLGSFIFGLPSDRPETFDATATAAAQAEIAFAQFVTLTPYPGTVDFIRWEKQMARCARCLSAGFRSPGAGSFRRPASETLLAPSHHVRGRSSRAYPVGLGHLLQHQVNLGAFPVHQIDACPPGLRLDLENLSSDVCRYRNRDRQCPGLAFSAVGPLAGKALPAPVCGSSHASSKAS